jgi:hypothetical protein
MMILVAGIGFGLLTVVGGGPVAMAAPDAPLLSMAGVPLSWSAPIHCFDMGGARASAVTAAARSQSSPPSRPQWLRPGWRRVQATNLIRNRRSPVSANEEGRGPAARFPIVGDTNVHHTVPQASSSARYRRCHTDIYEQWKSSTHHFSSFNNQ